MNKVDKKIVVKTNGTIIETAKTNKKTNDKTNKGTIGPETIILLY